MAFIWSQMSLQTSLNDFNWLMTKQQIKIMILNDELIL